MLEQLKLISDKSSFARKLSEDFGAGLYQLLLSLVATPVIANLYSPQSYGEFAIFLSVATLLGTVVTLQLPSVYALTKDLKELKALIFYNLRILGGFVVAILILVILIYQSGLGDEVNPIWLFGIPAYLLLSGLQNMAFGYSIRLDEFRRGAIAKSLSVTVGKGSTILFGLIVGPLGVGLLVGQSVILIFESLIRIGTKRIWSTAFQLFHFGKITIEERFSQLPKFLVPSALISNIDIQIPILLAALYFNPFSVGLISLANSIVAIPIAIFLSSISSIYLKKISDQHLKGDQIVATTRKTLKSLIALSSLPLAGFVLLTQDLVSFILRPEWLESVTIIRMIASTYVIGIPGTLLRQNFKIQRKEGVFLTLISVYTVAKALAFLAGAVFVGDLTIAYLLLSVTSSIHYLHTSMYVNQTLNLRKGILLLGSFFMSVVMIIMSYMYAL